MFLFFLFIIVGLAILYVFFRDLFSLPIRLIYGDGIKRTIVFEDLHPPTITAFGALISVLAVVFYALLYPVREKQTRFESELKEIKAELLEIKALLVHKS